MAEGGMRPRLSIQARMRGEGARLTESRNSSVAHIQNENTLFKIKLELSKLISLSLGFAESGSSRGWRR